MKASYAISLLCQVMRVSESGYYAWHARPKNVICLKKVEIEARIKALFIESKSSIGSRKISKQLKKEGYSIGRYLVRRIMKAHNLIVKTKRRFVVTTDSSHQNPAAKNILNRHFNPSQPNQVWTTDITYLKSKSGWIYLSVVIDLFSRQVVGWCVNNTMTTDLCKQALLMAYWKRKPSKGLLP
jgi:putative transposase